MRAQIFYTKFQRPALLDEIVLDSKWIYCIWKFETDSGNYWANFQIIKLDEIKNDTW